MKTKDNKKHEYFPRRSGTESGDSTHCGCIPNQHMWLYSSRGMFWSLTLEVPNCCKSICTCKFQLVEAQHLIYCIVTVCVHVQTAYLLQHSVSEKGATGFNLGHTKGGGALPCLVEHYFCFQKKKGTAMHAYNNVGKHLKSSKPFSNFLYLAN